jgi:Protein of unknown function DUF72
MEKLETAPKLAKGELKAERPYCLPGILLDTSAFTANGWEGSFYPPGMKSRDFLSYYASQFVTVEIDSTFYGWEKEMNPACLSHQDNGVIPRRSGVYLMARLQDLCRVRPG